MASTRKKNNSNTAVIEPETPTSDVIADAIVELPTPEDAPETETDEPVEVEPASDPASNSDQDAATVGALAVEPTADTDASAATPSKTRARKLKPNQEMLSLASITRDSRIQPRSKMNEKTLDEYTERWQEGDEFPAVIVYRETHPAEDGGEETVTNWLADGWHRVYSREQAGFDDILAEIHEGTVHDAILYAAGSNLKHGLQRNNADKRRAVRMLLEHPGVIAQNWTDGRIAKHAMVTREMVSVMRRPERALLGTEQPATRLGADGKIYAAPTPTKAAEGPLTASEGASEDAAADGDLKLWECGSCGAVTDTPSLHCDTCNSHFSLTEYTTCPTCHPEAGETGSGPVEPIATVVDDPATVATSTTAPTQPTTNGTTTAPGEDYDPGVMGASGPYATLRILQSCLQMLKAHTSIDATEVASIVSVEARPAMLVDLKETLDWVDAIEQALQQLNA